MSTNNMENPNGERSDASKNEHSPQQLVPAVPNNGGHCSEGDVAMHEHGAQLHVNLDRLETDSLRRYLNHFEIEGIDSDSSREEMLNAVKQHFASMPPLDEHQVIPEFINAAKKRYCPQADASENEQRLEQQVNEARPEAEDSEQRQVNEARLEAEDSEQQQVNEAQLEAADSDQDLMKIIRDFKKKGAKPDSTEAQRPEPVIWNFEEPLNERNPAVPNNEDHCSGGDVSLHEQRAQLKVNLGRLETDLLRRYISHYKIEGFSSDSSREEMLNAVQQHFASQPPLDEQQVIPEFMKRLGY